MKKSVIANPSSYVLITTIVYALLATTFFEMDNVLGERENVVIDNNNDNNSKTANETQHVVETQCKSPCSSSAEMCIQICA
jgi:hypothetical protein